MKKLIALILAVCFAVSLAGCGTGGAGQNPAPPDGGGNGGESMSVSDKQPPGRKPSQREDGEIVLKDLGLDFISWYMAVDEDENIYLADDNIDGAKVYKVDLNNRPDLFVDGLERCNGISAVGNAIYIFDLHNMRDLYMLKYDKQGQLLEEKSIPLDLGDYDRTANCFVFQDVPIVYLKINLWIDYSGAGMYTYHYLYNIRTGVLKLLDNADDYDNLLPLSDNRLLAQGIPDKTYSLKTVYLLTIDEDGGVQKDILNRNNRVPISVLVHDTDDDSDYIVTFQGIMRLETNGSETFLAAYPFEKAFIGNYVRCVNGRLYLLSIETAKNIDNTENAKKKLECTIMTFGIPKNSTARRELRILNMYNSAETYLRDYLSDFRAEYSDIEVVLVEPENALMENGARDLYLALQSGEMDVDIILIPPGGTQRFENLTANLATFSDITNTLNNKNLLEGVKESCLKPNGEIFGIPVGVGAGYRFYIVNTPLFQRLGLVVPGPDWTVNDFYDLAINASQQISTTYLCGVFESSYIQGIMTAAPLYSGWNSSNGYLPRIDTPQMNNYLIKCVQVYQLFPFKTAKSDKEFFTENMLLWDINFLTIEYTDILEDRLYQQGYDTIILPLPKDMYGNRQSPFNTYMAIYPKASNPDDAALFIIGFLDESWQRKNAMVMQLYNNASNYEKLGIPAQFEDVIALITKDTVHYVINEEMLIISRELDTRLLTSELTSEQYARELQKEVERRIYG